MKSGSVQDIWQALKGSLVARSCVLAALAGILGWQFLPPWFKLAVVYSTAAPVGIGLATGTAVGWLRLSWRLFAKVAVSVGALAFLALAFTSGLAGCAVYPLWSKTSAGFAWLNAKLDDELAEKYLAADADLASLRAERSCSGFADTVEGARRARR
jgi:hypothetical protein